MCPLWSTTPPLCDSPSGCCFFTGPWTVTRSSLRMLRRVAAFCRPLQPVLLPVSLLRSQSPVVCVLGLCWMWRGVPFARQRRPIIYILRMCWLLPGSFDCFCCPPTLPHPVPTSVLTHRGAKRVSTPPWAPGHPEPPVFCLFQWKCCFFITRQGFMRFQRQFSGFGWCHSTADLPLASASSDTITKSRALLSSALGVAVSYRVLVCDGGRYYWVLRGTGLFTSRTRWPCRTLVTTLLNSPTNLNNARPTSQNTSRTLRGHVVGASDA